MDKPTVHTLAFGSDRSSAEDVAAALAADGWDARAVATEARAHNDRWAEWHVRIAALPGMLPQLWRDLTDTGGDGRAPARETVEALVAEHHRSGDAPEADAAEAGQQEPGEQEEPGERAFLASYDPHSYAPVSVAVDVVLLTIRDGQLKVLLVERGGHPFKGAWALPGGFVEPDEDADAAAARELAEETGMEAGEFHLEQLRTYSAPDRDPRMRVFSVAYVAFAPDLPDPVAGSDAARARFFSVADLALGLTDVEDEPAVTLAFDHAAIVADGVERARAKLEYTTLATSFLTAPFTIGDLRRIYEAVWGTTLHPGNFHRKVLAADGFVRPTDEIGSSASGRGRPAQLYVPGPAAAIAPPLTRSE